MLQKNHKYHRNKAIYSSFWIVLFTIFGFLGFFLRDYLMAKVYGFGSQLDTFYLVTMIPMFMVTIFCVPFGQAIVPKLKKTRDMDIFRFSKMVRYFAFFAFFFCLFLCLLTYLLSDFAFFGLHYLGWIKLDVNIKFMQITVLPILLLSGLVILCNAILSANERYIYPSIAQLIVPIFAICFLLIFGKSYGVYAVILGMFLGQFANFIVVNYGLKLDGVELLPLETKSNISKNSFFWRGYSHLVAIAIFSVSLMPINTFIASSLGSGAISVFNLGNKFSLFVIGVLTTLFATVLLPYLTRLSTYQNKNILNKETFYLLFFSTFIFIPFSLLGFIYANFISKLIFNQIANESATVLGIASVIKYSVIQLPFWVFNAIIFKHANAINKVGIVLLSTIIMLVLNIILSLSLIKFMNVGGLSLATTISCAIASIIMLINYVFKKYLKLFEGVVFLIIWFVFGIILIRLNFNAFLILLERLM
jgi:putative peptidoglycan lipid II flippase